MRIKWTRLLFRLLGFESLTKELVKLLVLGVYSSFKVALRRRLMAWTIKVVMLLVLLVLVQGTLLFGLAALALYLNTLLGSNCQGLLLVSGGSMVLLLLLWLLSRIHWPRNR